MATVIGTQTGETVLDKGVVLKGTALLTPGDTTLSVPIPTEHQAVTGRELEITWEVDLEEETGAGVLPPVTDPPPHAPTHISSGADEIDGDKLDIDFTPTSYTPDTTPPEVTIVDELSAHLAGLDEATRRGSGVVKTIGTSDAILTTIATIAIPDDTVVHIQARIIGRRTDAADRGVFRREVAVYREAAGSATKEGSTSDIFTSKSDALWDVEVNVSGNNVLIQVKGAGVQTVNWKSIHWAAEVA